MVIRLVALEIDLSPLGIGKLRTVVCYKGSIMKAEGSVLTSALAIALASYISSAGAQIGTAAQQTGPGTEALISRDPSRITFQRNYWDAEWRSHLLLAELMQSDWKQRLKLGPPPADKAQIAAEISYLHSLKGSRNERREEIKQQNEYSIIPYFFPVLLMHQWSHPRTFELMHFASAASLLVFPFKHQFNRARPSQLAPSLQPIILVPGHPAYPSGHAFQSWLTGLLLAELRPDARAELMTMAERISVNREIAGVHFPSDTQAGYRLAEQVLEIAKDGRLFQELLTEAKAEWR